MAKKYEYERKLWKKNKITIYNLCRFWKFYDPKQESKHIIYLHIYLDANNLYGYIMSKFLPTSGFKWIDPKEFNLNRYTSNSSIDLEYANKLR